MKTRRFRLARSLVRLGSLAALLVASPASADSLTSQEISVPFTQQDGTILQLDTMVLFPSGRGPFPLAVISHGSPRRASDRPGMSPNDFFSVGKWFAELGFAVAIPMRRGYGHSFTSFAEGYGSCTNPDYVGAGRASAQDIEAVVGFMRRQPGVDPNRVVLIGHSAGGWGTLAAASENPAGLAAAIVFAPGRGSTSPGQVCGGDALAAAAGSFGAAVHVPSLWIYSENDHFFSPPLAHQIFDAFQGASRAPAEFLAEPACSEDGHMLVRRCPDLWHASVATFVQKILGRP